MPALTKQQQREILKEVKRQRTARARVIGSPREQYAHDVTDAMCFRAGGHVPRMSAAAERLSSRPLWVVAADCLQLAGRKVDMYGDRESIAEEAMATGGAYHHTFFSETEDRRYVQASSSPANRPATSRTFSARSPTKCWTRSSLMTNTVTR